MAQIRTAEEYELLPRASSDSVQSLSDLEHEHPFSSTSKRQGISHSFWLGVPSRLAYLIFTPLRHCRDPRQRRRRLYWPLTILPCIIIVLLFFTSIFRPSYTHPPAHYRVLESKCKNSQDPGRGNINNEKVFIAATLYDQNGLLLGGEWGAAVVELVQLLGPKNVYLSVYENDPDDRAKEGLDRLGKQLSCNVSLVSEHLSLEDVQLITIPSGEKRMKRVAFLSEVRNRALRPLQDNSIRFDKLLYINDVIFNPVDAVQLLFSTNIDTQGRTQYGAACAFDFINPFKFYDRFATRDFEGYETGIPIFPWFTDAGDSASRQDVLAQKDAVRVRACWGGLTAFEASWFQSPSIEPSPSDNIPESNINDLPLSPLRFRYELDPFWDASECCLIHADLTYLRHGRNATISSGIYANPYVRVAYDSTTLSWLPYTRRAERLYPLIHNIINHLVGLPNYNPRRLEEPGDEVVEKVWSYDENENMPNPHGAPKGSYHDLKRNADPGGFCGLRTLMVLNNGAKEGEKKWMKIPVPLPSS